MSLYETGKMLIEQKLQSVTSEIYSELVYECPERSGEAKASIAVQTESEFSRFVGGTNSHLFFADEGNNQSMSVIYPRKKKMLKFTDGSLHPSASTYKGHHFVKDVADKHR